MTDESASGRIFFSSAGRTLAEEDQLCVLSVGVDIGSSTSHLAFSRIVLERLDNRYVVTERETFFEFGNFSDSLYRRWPHRRRYPWRFC